MAEKRTSRDRFVTTAARLFMRQGYHATGLAQIVSESGAPKGSLYFHFPGGKEQLAAAAVERAGSVFGHQLDQILAAKPDPASALARLCDLLGQWMAQSGFSEGCPITNACLELAPGNAPVAEACHAIFSGWKTAWEGHLIADGWPMQSAPAMATTIVAALEGAFILARASQSVLPFASVHASLTMMLAKSEIQ